MRITDENSVIVKKKVEKETMKYGGSGTWEDWGVYFGQMSL